MRYSTRFAGGLGCSALGVAVWVVFCTGNGMAWERGTTEAYVRTAAPMTELAGLDLEGPATVVSEGPGGRRVLCSEGPLKARVALRRLGIDPKRFDLLKLEVKADAGAFLRVSLENYPEPGDLSHWYVLDSARAAFDWRTIWVDLRKPEEIKRAGAYKGMEQKDPNARGLRLQGRVAPSRHAQSGTSRRLWLGPVRFVRKAVDLNWDQRQAPYTWEAGKDLVFDYPLTVSNRLDRPVTALLSLVPFQARHAKASLSSRRVELAPRQARTVRARIVLPASVAAKEGPLYCERFEARARAEGIEDSDVTILRSSDPIHLTVTVPVPEAKLNFPLLPRRKDINAKFTGFAGRDLKKARAAAAAVQPKDLDICLDGPLDLSRSGYRGFAYWGGKNSAWAQASSRYRQGVTACAFLYDLTGEKEFLRKGTALLLRAAELFPSRRAAWAKAPTAVISHGIFTKNTLGLGWATGSMRAPYRAQRHGLFNDFDLLARDMDPQARRKIIDEFILPAAIHMRNHYFGLTNQQDVVNYPVMYAGLVSRNWALVSFAFSSEHGVRKQIALNFTEDGLCGEGHYQSAVIRPVLWSTELLYQLGIDLYDQRLHTIVHSPAAKAIGKPYRDSIVSYLDQHRFRGKKLAAGPKTDGVHVASGTTLLRWKGLEVGMNWGTHIMRNAADRCSLRIQAPRKAPWRALSVGGSSYTHGSLGQSIIIVDEGLQDSRPARVRSVDVEGPVQHIQAVSDAHYPGVTITRTFALLGRHVLVVDRVSGRKARTVDWCLKNAGPKVSVSLEEKAGSFTRKKDDSSHGVSYGAGIQVHGWAQTDATWSEGEGRLTMLGAPQTEVMVFRRSGHYAKRVKKAWRNPTFLMVRRRNVRQTDFVAFLSVLTRSVERGVVKKSDGRPADAVGVRITLKSGETFRALVSYEPKGTEVAFGPLRTTEAFATDYTGAGNEERASR